MFQKCLKKTSSERVATKLNIWRRDKQMGEEKNNGRHHSKRVPTLISEWTLQHLGIYILKIIRTIHTLNLRKKARFVGQPHFPKIQPGITKLTNVPMGKVRAQYTTLWQVSLTNVAALKPHSQVVSIHRYYRYMYVSWLYGI